MACVLIPLKLWSKHTSLTQISRRSYYRNKRNSKNKSLEYSKFVANKKASITIIFGQCNKATKTKITLGETYVPDHQAGRLIKFLKRLRTVCFGSDDGGLSYASYKQVVAVKSLSNFSNNKPHDPHGSKKEIKIKYDSL